MNRFLIFAGTTEGRRLALDLAHLPCGVVVQVATQYGGELVEPGPHLQVRVGRLDEAAMERALAQEQYDCVVDATHPYAQQVTANLAAACQSTGTPYLRLLREAGEAGDWLTAQDTQQAVNLLNTLPGNILLATGSKELAAFTGVQGYQQRVYPRMLPMGPAVEQAVELGFARGHIIAMQGPFSAELNRALLEQFSIQTLVTKDGGGAGGFAEKVQGAQLAGAKLLVIGRPLEPTQGHSYQEVWEILKNWGKAQ